jgi:hypothetical protein
MNNHFVDGNLAAGLNAAQTVHAKPRDWKDDGGSQPVPQQTQSGSKSRWEHEAKADSHLDDRTYLTSIGEVDQLRTFGPQMQQQ